MCVYVYIYISKGLPRASNEIFSPSNKIHRGLGQAKDLSAPRYVCLRPNVSVDDNVYQTKVSEYYLLLFSIPDEN